MDTKQWQTPKPWRVEAYKTTKAQKTQTIIRAEQSNVCRMDVAGRIYGQKTLDADSALIAAAPELLEALEAVMNKVSPLNDMPEAIQARAAIAKAKGEQS